MLREAVLMQAGQKDQFVARSRAIHHRLRVISGLDGMLSGMQQRRECEEEEKWLRL
jgi:glutamyl-tRNA reductase